MKSFTKKYLHIIIPTLCLILAVGIIIPLSLSTYEGREISYDYSISAAPDTILAVGYEKNGSTLTPKDEIAYLVLPVADEKINDVRIKFKGEISEDCRIALMYATENSGLSVDNSVSSNVKKGQREYYCTVPYDTYTVLECYIPTEIEIDSVILSHVLTEKPVQKLKLNTPLLIWTLVPTLLIYGATLAALILKKKGKSKRDSQ